jgi:hypothetical protein
VTGSPPQKPPAGPRRPTPAVLRKLTPAPGRRVDERVAAEVPVVVRLGKRRLDLVTGDVSHGGLFVRTEESLDLRQLVRVELILTTDGKGFTAMGWLVHARPLDGKDRGAGVGVQFYGVGREEQTRWDGFVAEMRAQTWLRNVPRDATPARGFAVPREHKRDAAHVAVIRVKYASLADLGTMLARDVERGALFFATDQIGLAVGDRVGLEIVHPLNGDVFEIDGRIRRVVDDQRVRGLEVKIAMDEERRRRFGEFASDPLSAEDDPGDGG